MKCDWCSENYSDGLWDEHFRQLKVYDKMHTIY